MSNIKYCMSVDDENIVISSGYVFSNIPDGSILISKEQYTSGVLDKKLIALPEYDENGNVTKDAILEEVQP